MGSRRACLLVVALLLPAALQAIPTYAEATEILKKQWNERYPAKIEKVQANPEKRGVYRTYEKEGLTYYYQFKVSVPRLIRAEDQSLKEEGLRGIEVWMRYRPGSNSFDLAFVRRDLLPGGGTWIKIP